MPSLECNSQPNGAAEAKHVSKVDAHNDVRPTKMLGDALRWRGEGKIGDMFN